MIVLDTNVLSEEMRPAPEPAVHGWLARQSPLDLFTTAVTEAEILYGVAIKPDGRRNRDLEVAARRVLGLFAGRILPFDSAEDRKKENPSSFGSWVRHLRPYAGREDPENEIDRFEKIYIALYEPDGSNLRFFDVQDAPPKNGRPAQTLDYRQFLGEVYHAYLQRNQAEFRWAEGDEEPLDVEEEIPEEDDEA